MSAMVDYALDYAEQGYAVFPVKVSDKSPLTSHGVQDATTDTDQIRQWWDMYPEANIAVACGRKSGDLFVIDVDVKHGKHGDQSLMAWQAQHGDFPTTVTALTGSGGQHLWFRYKGIEKFKNTVDVIDGVDIRGDGAYVVVPPSVYPDGRQYKWDRDVSICDSEEIAGANISVLQLLEPKSEKKARKENVADVAEGSRNETLFKFVCTLLGRGVPENVALTSALELSAGWSNPLPEQEIRKIVRSAYQRYEPNEDTIYGETVPEADDLNLQTLDEFEENDVDWMIRGYLPKGQITLVCGTGGTGKTSVWASLVASISTGSKTLFDGYIDIDGQARQPQKVIFFSAEDTIENVIKKKLRKQGANMSNILSISIEDKRFDKIKFGSKFLEAILKKYRPALCVFDPLQAFIDSRIKMSDRNAMRQNMRSLIEWGKEYGTTFLIVMHTNKLSNVWGRQRMADSADLWDIARCVWMVGDTDQEGVKYLRHEKSNYGRTGQTMLFRNDNGNPTFQGWTDKKDKDYVMAEAKAKNAQKGASTVEEAERMILSTLEEYPEGMLTGELSDLMTDLGFKKWVINEAKANLKDAQKIIYRKDSMQSKWLVQRVQKL